MELGALVCTPTTPKCGTCPLAANCIANREKLQAFIPPPKKLKDVTFVQEVGVVIRDGGKVLLCRRPADAARWQNMWEVPHAEVRDGEPDEDAAVRVAQELTGLDVTAGPHLTTIKHGVTRFAITLVCLEAARRGGAFAPGFYAEGWWVTPAELADYPVSSPQRKLMTALADPNRQRRLF
jgi:A/G-specific adenine glycosylase